MSNLIVISALVLIGFGTLGLALGAWSILFQRERVKLSQCTLDGLALGAIVVALYWAVIISYGVL